MKRAAFAVVLALCVSAGARAEATERFALVLGNNAPLPGSDYAPLQYADDDALRFAEFQRARGAKTLLLVSPDAETRERLGHLAEDARPPDRRNLEAAVAQLREAMAAAEGPTELFMYFSAHGSVGSASAHLHLLDAPLTRTELHDLLRQLPATRAHVVIDSCHAYFLVNARGDRIAVTDDEADLSRFAHVGFLLSTSERKEVYEWSGYRAGVFSYQLLGAMRGAADVDGDGRVSYTELHAYIALANAGVTDPQARIQPYVRRPALGDGTLVDLESLAQLRRAEVPDELAGHFRVHDAHGERLVDANKPPGTTLALMLPPGQDLYLSTGEGLWTLTARGQRFEVAPPSAEQDAANSRGGVADQLRERLFLEPLSEAFVSGFATAQRLRNTEVVPVRATPPPWYRDLISLSLFSAGVVGLGVGGAYTGLYLDSKRDADRRPVGAGTAAARRDAEQRRTILAVGYGVGGALIGAGLLRLLWPGGDEGAALTVMPGVGPGTTALQAQMTW